MFSFLPVKNNSETIGINFLSDSISTMISSNTINTFLFFVVLYFSKCSYALSILYE